MSKQQISTSQSIDTTPLGDINEDAPVGFFAIGLVINLVLLGAFVYWAIRQGKKRGERDES